MLKVSGLNTIILSNFVRKFYFILFDCWHGSEYNKNSNVKSVKRRKPLLFSSSIRMRGMQSDGAASR